MAALRYAALVLCLRSSRAQAPAWQQQQYGARLAAAHTKAGRAGIAQRSVPMTGPSATEVLERKLGADHWAVPSG